MVVRRFLLESLDRGRGSKFLRLAHALVEDIQRGRLLPGETLPSTRELAATLGVQRKTVIRAYAELARQGWVSSERARRTFVAVELPRAFGRARVPSAVPVAPGYALPDPILSFARRREGLLLLLGGIPELRFAKELPLARAYHRALRGASGRRLLDYGDPAGEHRLRAALAELMRRTRAIPCDVENVAVVRGTQQAVYLAARALLPRGARVAVEALGYPSAFAALRAAGAELVPVPVDGEGMVVEHLARLAKKRRLAAAYVTPHHQLPTTVTLSPRRRAKLMELARAHRLLVLEDDYDHEFQYEGGPVPPLASRDGGAHVVYLGTLAKVVAPGIRVGFVVAHPEAIERITAYRVAVDRQGDPVVERMVADLIEEGEIERHVRRAARAYRLRRDALAEALSDVLPQLRFDLPGGGMAIWARAPDGTDVDAWAKRGLDMGVAFQPASLFALDRAAAPWLRLGFAACDERELRMAVARMAAAWPGATRRARA